jgi:hypothetical protein
MVVLWRNSERTASLVACGRHAAAAGDKFFLRLEEVNIVLGF